MLRQRWSPRSSQGKIWAFSHSFFGTVRLRRPGWRRSWHFGYPASTEVVDHHQGRCELLFALFRTVRRAPTRLPTRLFSDIHRILRRVHNSFSRLPKTPKRRNKGKKEPFFSFWDCRSLVNAKLIVVNQRSVLPFLRQIFDCFPQQVDHALLMDVHIFSTSSMYPVIFFFYSGCWPPILGSLFLVPLLCIGCRWQYFMRASCASHSRLTFSGPVFSRLCYCTYPTIFS